jgi:DNA-binding CsgD family transcriptional regulator
VDPFADERLPVFERAPDAGRSTMGTVPTRVSSPRFVAREEELERLVALYKAAASDERAATVLLGGEAGVGKTRLVSELSRRVQESGGLCISGMSLELVDRALPFGPVVQALRALHRELDPATLDAVVGPAHEALARLLPEIGDASPGDSTMPASLFEQLLGVLERLGDRVPTLIVLEDVHWADHSTRDLLVFLARNLRDARVLLVASFRSDDLHRRHPLRAVLAELERSGAGVRIELERFDRDEMRELLGAILGAEPSGELVDTTYRRSDGNAFFAEELLAASDVCADALPDTLRDIVLVRVDALSESAQHVLRVMSVVGRKADHRLVAALASLDEVALHDALRECVAHQVLVTDNDGVAYRFRHALVHEAVYDDLLPGERVRLYTQVAELLTQHHDWFDGGEAALAAELACNWYAAHNAPRALPAALNAARAAEGMYAFPEALAHTERALELWPQVPDAEALAGMRHIDVVRYAAAQAELAGAVDRALDFVKAAADEVDPTADPVTAALVQERWGRVLWMLRGSTTETLFHCTEAVRLVPDEASPARARVLATLGQHLMLSGRNAEAITVCQDAIALAQQIGERVVEGHARNSLGTALASLDQVDAGLEQLELAHEIARETHSWSDAVRATINQSGALSTVGRHEDALAVALEGVEIAREHGLERSFGAFVRLNAANAFWLLGRWDELADALQEVDAISPVGVDAWRSAQAWVLLHAARGEVDAARREFERMRVAMGPDPEPMSALTITQAEVTVLVASGEFQTAMERTRAAAAQPFDLAMLCADSGIPLVLDGVTAAAELAEAARRRGDAETATKARENADELEGMLRGWIDGHRWGGGVPGQIDVFVAQVAAEAARAAGADASTAASDWRAIADQWAEAGELPRVAYARLREAEALVVAGDRAAASDAARAGLELASTMDATVLRDALGALARRARLDVGDVAAPSSDVADQLGLTAREREVLELVAAGRTNRQIADALFISTKTASVHVSNILAKLGVSNRAEAGAAARRLGLDGVAV